MVNFISPSFGVILLLRISKGLQLLQYEEKDR